MADQSSDAEAYVDAAAALTGLPIDPAHHPGVIAISSASRRWRLWPWNFRCSMRPTGAGVPAKSRDLTRTDAATIATAVRAGATTAVAVTEAALARIEQRNPALNRSTAITVARALATPRAARRLAPSMFATLATAAAAASVPLRDPGQMPIGVEIIAAPWWETDALWIAWELEQHGVTAAMRMDCRD